MDVALFGEPFFYYDQRAYHHAFELNAAASSTKTMADALQEAVYAFCSVSLLKSID